MRTSLLAVVLVLLVAAVSGCSSGKEEQRASTQKLAASCGTDSGAQEVAITGSYLKQPVTRNGMFTDFSSPVQVIDSEAIRNSGATDVQGVMRRYGAGQ